MTTTRYTREHGALPPGTTGAPLPSRARKPAVSSPGSQSGYALLLVFALSAIIAIELYQQLPRAAFEAQREKESLLIDHGEQYIRGVKLYVRKMGRYPAKMEDLDNTQNIRFLRKHYIDPMTGKEEWRLLHMGSAGKLIDSKIETADPNKDQWHAGSITEFKSPASSSSDGGPEGANLAARHRPSDDVALGPMGGNAPPPNNTDPAPLALNASGVPSPNLNPGVPGNPATPGGPADPNNPNQTPKPPAWVKGGPLPGLHGVTAPQGYPNAPPSSSTGANSSVSGNGGFGSSISGNGGFGTPTPPAPATQQPQFGQPVNSQYPGPGGAGTSPSQYPTGFQNPAQNTGTTPFGAGGQNSPGQMINNLLTQPRPGGAPPGVGLPGMGGSVMGGLAGVASNFKGHGIRHYNDQDEYQKWEFFYDLGADQKSANGVSPLMNPGSGQPYNPATGAQPNGFSNQPNGFSNQSNGFSNQSNGFSNQQSPGGPPSSGFGNTIGTPLQRSQ